MKKNTNIIQIRGIRGLIIAAGVVSCLVAGFVVFPGWICMNIWNQIASYIDMPTIGVIQGVILWAIMFITYKIARKEKFIICVKSPQGLTEEELKEVFSDIKKQSKEEMILQAMMKARESELKVKHCESEKNETERTSDNTKV